MKHRMKISSGVLALFSAEAPSVEKRLENSEIKRGHMGDKRKGGGGEMTPAWFQFSLPML